MFCKKCGVQLPDGAKFCPNCSAKVDGAVTENDKEKKLSTGAIAAIAAAAAIVIAVVILVVITGGNRKAEQTGAATDTPKEITDYVETESETETVPAQITEDVTSSSSSTSETPKTEKSESTTEKSTAKTTTKATPSKTVSHKQAMIKAYTNQIKKEPGMGMYNEYYVYDIDGDGSCELIIDIGNFEAERCYNIYKYNNGQVVPLGSVPASHGSVYSPASGKGIIVFSGHMGVYSARRFNVEAGALNEDVLAEGELHEDEEYDDYKNIYCNESLEGSTKGDYSLLSEKIK